MLKYRYIIAISVLALLIGACVKSYRKAVKYKQLYDTAKSNILAYEADLDSLKLSSRMYYLTIDQLKQSNDSLLRKTIEYAKELKIKQKTIQNISYQTSVATKTDTLYVLNVIKENARLDTLLNDKWYSLRLTIAHPDTVIITPEFKSQRFAYITAQREIDGKPSKWFFIRWFQRRRTVITVDVHEENPYIDIKQQKFVEIIK